MQQQGESEAFGGSIRVAEIGGVAVKVHILFLAWIAFQLFDAKERWLAELTFLLVLFLSVLLHELGHCFGAWLVGGKAYEIVLWPLGGFTRGKTPDTWKAQLGYVAFGPIVNLLLVFVGIGLVAADGLLSYVGQHPGALRSVDSLRGQYTALGLTGLHLLAINLFLFVFNVIPAYPMDGGQLLRSVLWPILGWRRATLVATTLALGFGALFAGLGVYLRDSMLTIIGLLVLFASWQEMQKARMAGGWRKD